MRRIQEENAGALSTQPIEPESAEPEDPGISTPCSFLHLKHQHLSSIRLTPSSQRRRQLNDLPSQVKTVNLSTPGGSSFDNLLVFPVLVPELLC
ncbi:hypothetical protein ILYODFUR_037223 [Ilyodon furcidens]|uniref:Uncharacterized protein n=1 Tax=Ilyodon furcidens TaxID=33524 RepID=A0ABV0VLT0_9TELE